MGATRIMGTPNGVPLRIFFFSFFSFIFFGKMILPISLWLILSAVVVTARMDKPGGEIINNVDKAAASTEEGDKEIMQPALDRHRLRDMDWDTKDTGNERSSKKLSGQNMNKRMKHWPAAIQGASAVADELDEAKRESLAEKKEIKMADEEIEDEAESGEVDDAKSNKVALRQKNDCNNGRCPRCEKKKKNNCKMFYECVDHCKGLQKDENDIAPGIWNTCEEACEHHCICKSEILVGGLRPTHRG